MILLMPHFINNQLKQWENAHYEPRKNDDLTSQWKGWHVERIL